MNPTRLVDFRSRDRVRSKLHANTDDTLPTERENRGETGVAEGPAGTLQLPFQLPEILFVDGIDSNPLSGSLTSLKFAAHLVLRHTGPEILQSKSPSDGALLLGLAAAHKPEERADWERAIYKWSQEDPVQYPYAYAAQLYISIQALETDPQQHLELLKSLPMVERAFHYSDGEQEFVVELQFGDYFGQQQLIGVAPLKWDDWRKKAMQA